MRIFLLHTFWAKYCRHIAPLRRARSSSCLAVSPHSRKTPDGAVGQMHTYLGRLRLLRDDVQSQQKQKKEGGYRDHSNFWEKEEKFAIPRSWWTHVSGLPLISFDPVNN